MLTPTVAREVRHLHAFSNLTASSLTKWLPHGQDAAILSLGHGDLRNVLYTAYVEKGLPTRNLDITLCDADEGSVARNILFLSLLIDDDQAVSIDNLWAIYYHLFVDPLEVDIVLWQTKKLLSASETSEGWNSSTYGRAIKFCDADSLSDVRKVWHRIKDATKGCIVDLAYGRKYCDDLEASRKSRYDLCQNAIYAMGMRASAPLSVQLVDGVSQAMCRYMTNGTVERNSEVSTPNPMFSGLITHQTFLDFSANPVLGYHLATAIAPLHGSSPLAPEQGLDEFSITLAAKKQFSEWVSSFKSCFLKNAVLRFAVADALMLCHGMQSIGTTGKSANLYRRPWDSRPLILDPEAYGRNGSAPLQFDVIDTSGLGDDAGVVNLLTSTEPLLKNESWASIYTTHMTPRGMPQTSKWESLLYGHAPTMCLLLGLSPVQYWTNAKCESHADEMLLRFTAQDREGINFHSSMVWKRDDQFSGQPTGRGRLHFQPQALARIIFQLFLKMFKLENSASSSKETTDLTASSSHCNPGSLAVLLKVVMNRVKTDWPVMCNELLSLINADGNNMWAKGQLRDLSVHLQILGVIPDGLALNGIDLTPGQGNFCAWKSIPPVVAVTLVVPRDRLAQIYEKFVYDKLPAVSLVGILGANPVAPIPWRNKFSDVQVVFGSIKEKNARDDDAFEITIEQDPDQLSGNSPLIATWYVPTVDLHAGSLACVIGLDAPPMKQTSTPYEIIVSNTLSVFETTIDDEHRVYVTKFMPGQEALPSLCDGVKPYEDIIDKDKVDMATTLLAEISPSESTVLKVTGHLDITSKRGSDLLKKKVPIAVHQRSPFVLNVVFGQQKLSRALRFPVPVTVVGSRARIARTSGYVEVIAPIAEASVSDVLDDFIYPVVLSSAGIPVALNTPHLNLDNLPILDVGIESKLRFLDGLLHSELSVREAKTRNEEFGNKDMMDDYPRLKFKSVLLEMFSMAAGYQSEQTGLFSLCLSPRHKVGGVQLLIFGSALRFDGESSSIVLDAAVMPITRDLIGSNAMRAFLRSLNRDNGTFPLTEDDLILWKKLLPSLTERCRTWSHGPNCEYKREHATIPLSLEPGEKFLCSCGYGEFPDNFIAVPGWDIAAQYAVRVAISPTYAVPFVEECMDPSRAVVESLSAAAFETCRYCGKTAERAGQPLKKCRGCMQVQYCSKECQKEDWKTHRGRCGAEKSINAT